MDIKILIEKSNQQILDTLKREVDKQASVISSLVDRLDTLTKTNELLEKKCQLLEENTRVSTKTIYKEIEDRARRKENLIFSGIPETLNGSLEDRKVADQEYVERILMNLSIADDGVITRIHRIGRSVDDKPRLLLVKCMNEEIKLDVLRNAKKLRNLETYKTIYVNPDLTLAQRQERKLLANELKRRRALGEDVVIQNNSVVLKSTIQNFHRRF